MVLTFKIVEKMKQDTAFKGLREFLAPQSVGLYEDAGSLL